VSDELDTLHTGSGRIFDALQTLHQRFGKVSASVAVLDDGGWVAMILTGEEEPGSDMAGGAGHGMGTTPKEALAEALSQYRL